VKGNFKHAYQLVRVSEGGNDDDPDDPGGRTSRGITQREYDAYRVIKNKEGVMLPGDVWEAPDWAVENIYLISYWQPHCDHDHFPHGVDYSYFDMRVNHGGRWATRLLQRALKIPDDGSIGIVTRTALMEADPRELLAEIKAVRQRYYQKLYWYKKYGKGWTRRNEFVYRRALAMLEKAGSLPA
jgi:lysozyme family protein